jgi:hypothetical protein
MRKAILRARRMLYFSVSGAGRLVSKFQAQLKRPGATCLVKRTESADTLRQNLSRFAKLNVAKCSVDQSEVRMVGNIERLRPKLKVERITDWKQLSNRDVSLSCAETIYEVSWGITQLSGVRTPPG